MNDHDALTHCAVVSLISALKALDNDNPRQALEHLVSAEQRIIALRRAATTAINLKPHTIHGN